MKTRILKVMIILLPIVLLSATCGKVQNDRPVYSKSLQDHKVFPKPIGSVNDYEAILTTKQVMELDKLIRDHEEETTNQIAIVTIGSIEPYEDLDQYSLDLANYWGVGQEDKNNGVLIVMGKKIRKIRIQNGLGIEEKLTNSETELIINEIITPEFKKENYFEGLFNGIKAIIQEIK